MKIKRVADTMSGYIILLDNGSGFMQRKIPKTAADYPLEYHEEILCAMCERMIEIQDKESNHRCNSCRYFIKGEEILGGLVKTNGKCYNTITPNGGTMYVYPEFGCVMWEEKCAVFIL